MTAISTRICGALIFIAALLGGCGLNVVRGSGVSATEARTVSGFSAVSLAGQGDLIVVQGETEALTIEAEDNILPHITTAIKDGTLIINFDRDDWRTLYLASQPIKFNLTMKDITALTLSGSGSIQAGRISAGHLTTVVSGSGSVKIDELDATTLTYNLSGSGNADFAGRVTDQDVTLSGSGQYRAGSLDSSAAVIAISGSGDAIVWARDSLDVNVSGSGSASYYGTPQITTRSSGSDSLNSLGDK